MSEKALVISIVVLTAIIISIFSYKTFKSKDHCSKCKYKNKHKM